MADQIASLDRRFRLRKLSLRQTVIWSIKEIADSAQVRHVYNMLMVAPQRETITATWDLPTSVEIDIRKRLPFQGTTLEPQGDGL